MKNENKIIDLCEDMIDKCDTCMGEPDYDCVSCTQGGKAKLARIILKLLQEDDQ